MELRFNLVDRTAAPLPYKILMHSGDVVLLPDIAPDLQLRSGCLSQCGDIVSSIPYTKDKSTLMIHEALQLECSAHMQLYRDLCSLAKIA